jgi:tetratricopeptide (TPR) repeat protein
MKVAAIALASVAASAVAQTAAPPAPPVADARAGITLFEARRFDDARGILAPLAEGAKSSDAEVLFYAGRLALRARDYSTAVRYLERAAVLDVANSLHAMWLGRAYAQDAINGSKVRLVFVARRSKNAFERAIALDPENIQARLDLGQYYMLVPGVLGGSMAKAREQVSEIRKRNAFWGHIAAASVAGAEKDSALAEREHRLAIAVAPDSVTGYAALAQFLYAHGRNDEAYAEVRKTIADHPDEAFPYYELGLLAANWKQHLDEGATALQKYLALLPREDDPPMSSAHYWLGVIFRAQGNADAARAEFRETLRLNPKSDRAKKALEAP